MTRLKELREARGLNQQGLAAELNVSQAMISKYELGVSEPDINTIRKITKFFGVTADYLIELSDEKVMIPFTGLSDIEKNVLFGFKRLTRIQKEKLLAYLQGLLQE